MMDLIYIRTSTAEQNPENQLNDISSIAPKDSNIFREKQSAWKDGHKDRPVFKKVYNLIKEDQVRSINVWDLDRIYRNRLRTVDFMKLCKYKGTLVRSYRQKWLNEIEKIPSPWNEIVTDLLIQVFGWIAEEESNKKSKRVKAAIVKEEGITKSYKGNKWGRKQMIPDEEKILELHKQGHSVRKIASLVKIKRPKDGKLIHPSKSWIHKILKKRS